jgi:hypothetical protein
MCDYSLHAFATRPAEVGETLVSTKSALLLREALRALVTRKSLSAFVPGPRSHSKRMPKRTGWYFEKRLAIDWRGFAKSIPKNLMCIMTLSNSLPARSF